MMVGDPCTVLVILLTQLVLWLRAQLEGSDCTQDAARFTRSWSLSRGCILALDVVLPLFVSPPCLTEQYLTTYR